MPGTLSVLLFAAFAPLGRSLRAFTDSTAAMPLSKVLVVGAGATGACVSLRLRQLLGRDVAIEVWEKARGPGGRMSTNRLETPQGATLRADMGAQYLSVDGSSGPGAELADLLVQEGVCAEVPSPALSETPERSRGGSWRHLAGVRGGVNDALKLLFEQAGAKLHFGKRVASIDRLQGKWRARPFKGAPAAFDAVVLAVPGCGVGGDNLNKIHGGWEAAISAEQNRQLLAVEHDHRWSFALYLPQDCAKKCDDFFGPEALERVVDDGTLHLLCYQSRKTERASGVAPAGGVVVVGHTTLAWAKRNARAGGRDQRLLEEVSGRMAATLKLDGAITRTMFGSKVITWKQSQVTKPLPTSAATGPCMLLSAEPPLLLAGDYFTNSSFSGCAASAFAAAEVLAKGLKGELPPSMAAEVAAVEGDLVGEGTGKKRMGGSSNGGGGRKGGNRDRRGGGGSEGSSLKKTSRGKGGGSKGH